MSLPHAVIPHSFQPEDVTFLLKPVALDPTGVAEKERRIQSGESHYSEMISREQRPDARYMQIFETAFSKHRRRIARDIAALALGLAEEGAATKRPIVLCSLVRAGVPYGVLLRRALSKLKVPVDHFAVSIIRDRGLDRVAMEYIRDLRPDARVVFVDGWTGKGAISTELSRSWQEISGEAPDLVTLADPSGFAGLSASHDDWLIPSGILGANVSGLVSRSILNASVIGPGDFHGAVPVPHLADMDQTRRYVDEVWQDVLRCFPNATPARRDADKCADLKAQAAACVDDLAREFAIENRNRIKPGIAEATRALLRRKPYKVILADAEDTDLDGIRHLSAQSDTDILFSRDLTGPYKAITLIEKIGV